MPPVDSSQPSPSSQLPDKPKADPRIKEAEAEMLLMKQPKHNSHKSLLIFLLILIVLLVGVCSWMLGRLDKTVTPQKNNKTSSTTNVSQPPANPNSGVVTLDPNKDYGNKYTNNILPVGDGKYATTTPQVGYVYACSQYAQSLTTGQGGAQTRGPWFTDNNTEYDLSKKLHVEGSVMWSASFNNNVTNGVRTIVTNDLPDHPTGIFPITTTDPAYAYDHNPNSIKAQELTYSLSASPTYGNPNCMGGSRYHANWCRPV